MDPPEYTPGAHPWAFFHLRDERPTPPPAYPLTIPPLRPAPHFIHTHVHRTSPLVPPTPRPAPPVPRVHRLPAISAIPSTPREPVPMALPSPRVVPPPPGPPWTPWSQARAQLGRVNPWLGPATLQTGLCVMALMCGVAAIVVSAFVCLWGGK